MHFAPEPIRSETALSSTRVRTPEPWLRHLCFLGPVAFFTLAALALALRALPLAGPARVVYAAAVAINVGLLALSSWSTILGAAVAFWQRMGGEVSGPVLAPPTGRARTAVLLPVYEEDAVRVFAAAAVMANSLAGERVGVADLFVLSDTQSAEGAAAEEQAHRRLLAQLPSGVAVHYRRRVQNRGRKAGNIAEFIGRWGTSYDFMVVLDADSLMTGAAMARLIGAMEANPNAGLIQSMCYSIGRSTLFARIQQFAARLSGPLLARGVAWWQGPRGSYWGHNAIVRIAAFAGHCGLPALPGRAPLGGEILCHDTVEATLLLRAGWDVWMLPDGPNSRHGGSWEETPTNLLDHLDRDRRWCQGNLQHFGVLRANGLKLASYVHLGQGIAHYLSAPLLLAMVVGGTLLPDAHAGEAGAGAALWTMILILMFAPRVLSVGAALADGAVARSFGGRVGLVTSVLLDQVFSLLAGPVSLVFYCVFVATTLAGRVVRWDAQPRDDRGLRWSEAGRRFGLPLGLAAVLVAALGFTSPLAMITLLPGLVVGIPLAVWTSRSSAGEWARRHRLFVTPEETAPPAILAALGSAENAVRHGTAERTAPGLPFGFGLPVIVASFGRRRSLAAVGRQRLQLR